MKAVLVSVSCRRQKMWGSGIRSGVGGGKPGSLRWEMAELRTWVLSDALGDLPLCVLPLLLTSMLLLIIMSHTTNFLNYSPFVQEVWCLSFTTFLIWDAESKEQKKEQHHLVQQITWQCSGGKFAGIEVESTKIRTMGSAGIKGTWVCAVASCIAFYLHDTTFLFYGPADP